MLGINEDGSITGAPYFSDETAFYAFLRDNGLIGRSQQKTIPGYIAPPVVYISVPNSRSGVMDGLHTNYPSIESWLQLRVQTLVGKETTQNMTDDQVAKDLAAAALDEASWVGPFDPATSVMGSLVSKYVAVYRTAVTVV